MAPGTVGLIVICALIYFLDGLIHSVLGPLAPQMARSLSLARRAAGADLSRPTSSASASGWWCCPCSMAAWGNDAWCCSR